MGQGIDDKLIEEIVRRIRAVATPDRIILFGSAATGTMTHDSDIDLLILEGQPYDYQTEWLRIRKSLRHLGYPFDILLMKTERFEDSKNVIGGMAFPANKDGKVIYEAA